MIASRARAGGSLLLGLLAIVALGSATSRRARRVRCGSFEAHLDLARWNGRPLAVRGWFDLDATVERTVGSIVYRAYVVHSNGTQIHVFTADRPGTLDADVPYELASWGHLVSTADMKQRAVMLGVSLPSDEELAIETDHLVTKTWTKYDPSLVPLDAYTPREMLAATWLWDLLDPRAEYGRR